MHFVMAWESQTQGERWREINNTVENGFIGYSWLRLLRTFYVLEIDSDNDWNVVHERMLAIASRFPGEFNFLMSPIYDLDSNYFVYEMPDKDFYQS